jgi:hypothetical protein
VIVELEATLVIGRSRQANAIENMLAMRRSDPEGLLDAVKRMDDRSLRTLFMGVMGAAGLVDTQEQAILDGIIQDPSYSGFATLYIGLSSTTPTEAGGNITEPSGGNYGRVSTVAADWSAASGTAPAVKTNTAVKTFGTASADWVSAANLTHFVLFDASSAGNAVLWGALGTAKPVLNGDTPSFAASAFTWQLGDPGDTY